MVEFTSDIPSKILTLLLDIGRDLGIDPLSSTESEAYFLQLLRTAPDDPSALPVYLRGAMERDFPIMETYPRWLQGAEWPFREGRPLCFVGQLEAAVKRDGCLRRIAFYIFWNPKTGESETIQQHD